jgi:hypothetical protein
MNRTLAKSWPVALLLVTGCGSQAPSGQKVTMSGAADHAKHFPIGSADIHGPSVAGGGGAQSYCNACHANADGTPAVAFTTYNCIGCHVPVAGGAAYHDNSIQVTAIHVGVANFAFDSPSCYACHPQGYGAPANHGALFPIGPTSAHKTVKCADCHLDPSTPHVLTTFACDTCHLALDPTLPTRHGVVSGVNILVVHTGRTTLGPPLTLTSPDCLRCHAESQVNLVSSHSTQDSGFGKTPHMGAGCVTCHNVNRTDKPYPATDWSTPTGWSSTNGCSTCHSSNPN